MTPAHGDPRVGGTAGVTGDEERDTPVVIRDRRRIDPESGEVRPGSPASGGTTPPGTGGGPAAPGDAEVAALRTQIAERTADLQRLKAEYDNYRRRVERDRQSVVDAATAKVLSALLPTLDDISRAREHGDLEGPFKAVAETLESTLENAGLERFGSVGEEFDPLVHDALLHAYRTDVTRPTCVEVFRSGYRHGGRVLRPAQVSVAEPESPPTPPSGTASSGITVESARSDDSGGTHGSAGHAADAG